MKWFITYWLHIALATGILSLVGAGFYGYKIYKEYSYKKSIPKQKDKFTDCLSKAETNEDYQNCWRNIK